MVAGEIEKLISLLRSQDIKAGYAAMNILRQASRDSNEVYPYINRFYDMLECDNSYFRTRALVLIAANARWDVDYKIDEFFDVYLRHITDVKPITARQCIKVLPEIAKYKPELKKDIASALANANISFYEDSMRRLIKEDISRALDKIDTADYER